MPIVETAFPLLALWALLGYLIGSVPYGVLLARLMGLGDLRAIGSGNIGATNVLRTGNKLAALLTLLFDGAKGAAAVLLARALTGEDAAQLAGLLAFLGHCYPVWLRFRGGKGVATFLGLMLALSWPVGLACCATWAAGAAASRMSSFAAIFAASLSTLWVLLLDASQNLFLAAALTLVVFWRHRENIARIKAGTEPRFGSR